MSYHDIDPQDIDPETNRPYANYSSPSIDTSFHDGEMDDDDEAEQRGERLQDDARTMGQLACSTNLQRDTNPFPRDSVLWDCWDAGYDEALAQWRAELRTRVADDYGDEAADYV